MGKGTLFATLIVPLCMFECRHLSASSIRRTDPPIVTCIKCTKFSTRVVLNYSCTARYNLDTSRSTAVVAIVGLNLVLIYGRPTAVLVFITTAVLLE